MNKSFVLELYRKMLRIRRFEEAVIELYLRGHMPGLAHSYAGQEAVAVGVCAALREDDYITSHHRGHGHLIAKGGRLDRMMAEILGKETGYNRGRGGTMHIVDVSLGILGANGIVGAGMGLAVGAGWSSKLLNQNRVAVAFFGDGGANQGIFLEAMNLAAIWKLPVIFACENNMYAQFTSASNVTAGKQLTARADALGVRSSQTDGQDVFCVYNAVAESVSRVRGGEGPEFIEFQTYRFGGHHVGDQGTAYRSTEEIADWKNQRDPLLVFKQHVINNSMCSESDLHAIEQEVSAEVEIAVDFAKTSPYPEPNEVKLYVYPDA